MKKRELEIVRRARESGHKYIFNPTGTVVTTTKESFEKVFGERKKYTRYANAAAKRRRDEMTIFDKDSGKYMNVKVWRERMPWEKRSFLHRWK